MILEREGVIAFVLPIFDMVVQVVLLQWLPYCLVNKVVCDSVRSHVSPSVSYAWGRFCRRARGPTAIVRTLFVYPPPHPPPREFGQRQ